MLFLIASALPLNLIFNTGKIIMTQQNAAQLLKAVKENQALKQRLKANGTKKSRNTYGLSGLQLFA